jgi:valyl-tRNA synthetase
MEFHLAAGQARQMLFDDFSGWYIGIAKERLYAGDDSACYSIGLAFRDILGILHPIMPFVTEEIAQHMGERLINSSW